MARSLISTITCSLAVASVGAASLWIGSSDQNAFAQSGSTSADRPASSTKVRDNSGKKLAVANFEPPEALEESKQKVTESVKSLQKSVEIFGQNVSDNYMPKMKAKKVIIDVPDVEVPASLKDLCEDCLVSGQQMAQFVREHAAEFTAVMAKYLKQYTDPPKITPVSSPYDSDGRIIPHNFEVIDVSKRANTRFFTPEGRLKTVVQR
ncbi:MAG: hypothetical protein H6677_07890 [Candidatus Obscuribacterales bacterium]|nr:hypothetical protein [Cyanobacteria bacterium HKST-UBA01]MCB9468188.1 hypothetical protein [Candidatus Obscuribacterales bacterium]